MERLMKLTETSHLIYAVPLTITETIGEKIVPVWKEIIEIEINKVRGQLSL